MIDEGFVVHERAGFQLLLVQQLWNLGENKPGVGYTLGFKWPDFHALHGVDAS
jgi:hypothetical protein